MTAASESNRLLRVVKDYWFLITLAASLLLSGIYMYVFHVTPWDTYRQIELRRNRVALYDEVGQRLLENGQYQQAVVEFDRALALDPLDDSAQWGRYLAELQIALPLPTWEASVWSAEREPLMRLARGREDQVGHVLEKYLGDVEQKIGNFKEAAAHYERALSMKPNYLDALYAYGWFSYATEPNRQRMETMFRRMTEADPYDYRGFHGLGYALYMRAVAAAGERGGDAIREAAMQSQRASYLKFQQLNVMVDFGEVARTVYPQLSQWFHEQALKLLDNPETASLPQVRTILEARLIKTDVSVFIESDIQRRAWVTYELALDHLATTRLEGKTNNKEQRSHDELLSTARKLDARDEIYPIYRDQLAILDQFLPATPLHQTSEHVDVPRVQDAAVVAR